MGETAVETEGELELLRPPRAIASLKQLTDHRRYEIIEGPESRPLSLVTIGCERMLWVRRSDGLYERSE